MLIRWCYIKSHFKEVNFSTLIPVINDSKLKQYIIVSLIYLLKFICRISYFIYTNQKLIILAPFQEFFFHINMRLHKNKKNLFYLFCTIEFYVFEYIVYYFASLKNTYIYIMQNFYDYTNQIRFLRNNLSLLSLIEDSGRVLVIRVKWKLN